MKSLTSFQEKSCERRGRELRKTCMLSLITTTTLLELICLSVAATNPTKKIIFFRLPVVSYRFFGDADFHIERNNENLICPYIEFDGNPEITINKNLIKSYPPKPGEVVPAIVFRGKRSIDFIERGHLRVLLDNVYLSIYSNYHCTPILIAPKSCEQHLKRYSNRFTLIFAEQDQFDLDSLYITRSVPLDRILCK